MSLLGQLKPGCRTTLLTFAVVPPLVRSREPTRTEKEPAPLPTQWPAVTTQRLAIMEEVQVKPPLWDSAEIQGLLSVTVPPPTMSGLTSAEAVGTLIRLPASAMSTVLNKSWPNSDRPRMVSPFLAGERVS